MTDESAADAGTSSQAPADPALSEQAPLSKAQRWWRRVRFALILALSALLLVSVLTRCYSGQADVVLTVENNAKAPPFQEPVRIMSLNLAHGRGASWRNQILLSEESIRENLARIIAVLQEHQPAFCCVQEADGPSFWSGDFDHVGHIAGAVPFAYHARGDHVDGPGLHYGTGILSQVALSDVRSFAFPASPPTTTKGFVVATFTWPNSDQQVDIVSLHLDFARASVRSEQIELLVQTVQQRGHPCIIVGDLNATWAADGATQQLVKALKLQAWQPESGEATFPTTGNRLDWILLSQEFRFVSYHTLALDISDHLPVLAEIALRP